MRTGIQTEKKTEIKQNYKLNTESGSEAAEETVAVFASCYPVFIHVLKKLTHHK